MQLIRANNTLYINMKTFSREKNANERTRRCRASFIITIIIIIVVAYLCNLIIIIIFIRGWRRITRTISITVINLKESPLYHFFRLERKPLQQNREEEEVSNDGERMKRQRVKRAKILKPRVGYGSRVYNLGPQISPCICSYSLRIALLLFVFPHSRLTWVNSCWKVHPRELIHVENTSRWVNTRSTIWRKWAKIDGRRAITLDFLGLLLPHLLNI